MEVTIHISKLFSQAQQLAIPGQEARWVARKLAGLFKAGKLVGFTQSPTGEWTKVNVTEVPTKVRFRGVSRNVADEISSAFWHELSRS